MFTESKGWKDLDDEETLPVFLASGFVGYKTYIVWSVPNDGLCNVLSFVFLNLQTGGGEARDDSVSMAWWTVCELWLIEFLGEADCGCFMGSKYHRVAITCLRLFASTLMVWGRGVTGSSEELALWHSLYLHKHWKKEGGFITKAEFLFYVFILCFTILYYNYYMSLEVEPKAY